MAAQAFHGGGETHPERILVVVELTGGNDGLDTVAPYSNDDYQQARPTLGLKADKVLKLNDEFGLHPSLGGLKKIWDEGLVAASCTAAAIPNPDRSHFSSMEYLAHGHAAPGAERRAGWAALPMPTGRRRSRTPSSISR